MQELIQRGCEHTFEVIYATGAPRQRKQIRGCCFVAVLADVDKLKSEFDRMTSGGSFSGRSLQEHRGSDDSICRECLTADCPTVSSDDEIN